ncbi:hypothetical protein EDC65_2869 [Stella humosa]|uniref:Lipoprotein n=2 Tax=Stella humosa TaxID=94 RepID=A0A3N1LJL9_9PROT|nr:hypothetical protein EDC65_2869 [Stella humosa]
MRGVLLMLASVALLATAACAPRFDMVGEEATSDPVAVKRTGQERRAQ